MNEFLLQSTYFGVVLSLLCYWVALKIAAKVKSTLCNPLMVSIVLIIIILSVFGISYETYEKSASYLTYLLTPTTVCLAVPLYRQYEVLKSNVKAIVLGIASGCVACMITLVALTVIRTAVSFVYKIMLKKITASATDRVLVYGDSVKAVSAGMMVIKSADYIFEGYMVINQGSAFSKRTLSFPDKR